MMRVGVFGGSFDPPHLGHVAVAQAAADQFSLATVLFVPTGRQPLKPAGPRASFRDRIAMLQLVASVDARFAISELDAPHPDGSPNYTVDLLRDLTKRRPEAKLYALSGADSFLEFPRWREPEALLSLAEWIVVSRPGFLLADLTSLPLTAAQRARIHLLKTVHEEVSATAVRTALAAAELTQTMIPEAVAQYIKRHSLYLG